MDPQAAKTGDINIDRFAKAGFVACSELISNPAGWINRRVETVEILSHEETRRRVSVDFTLPRDLLDELDVGEGVAVPLSVYAKQPRRHFDLRDEAGNAVPVLGREENAQLAHAALSGLALDIVGTDQPTEVAHTLLDFLWEVVTLPAELAAGQVTALLESTHTPTEWQRSLAEHPDFLDLLWKLAHGYLLVALLPPSTGRRRILKISYGVQFPTESGVSEGLWTESDPRRFVIETDMSSWAASFHLEIAIPEELWAVYAQFIDRENDEWVTLGDPDVNVDRVSLYSPRGASPVGAYIELAPEPDGQIRQALMVGFIVTISLFLGAVIGFREDASDAAASVLLIGAAIFSGINATSGTHRLVKHIFASTRTAAALIALFAVLGTAVLALDLNNTTRSITLGILAAGAAVTTGRLLWLRRSTRRGKV